MDLGAIAIRMSANTANLRSDMNEAKDVVTKATSDMAASTKTATAATADYTLSMKQQREAALAGAAAQAEYMDKLQSTAAKAVAANLSQADSLREQAKILGMTNVAEPYIAQIEKAAASTHSLSLANAGVTRELSVMAGEMARGNWTRFEGSMTVLANRTGLLQMAFSPMGALIAGVAAAVGVLGLAFVKGAQESAHLNDALTNTGNYAGMIAGDFQTMASSIAQSANVGIGKGKEALLDLMATGRVSGDALGVLTQDIIKQSDMTGEKLEKTAQDYAKMADGVAKWAEKHNESMHFMSLAQYEHIKALEEEGNKTQAMIDVGNMLETHFQSQTQNLGILQRAWKALGQSASSAWDSMMNIGRAESVSTRLDDANAAVYKARIDMGGNAGNTMQEREANLRKAMEQQSIAQADVIEAKRQANHIAEMARINEEGITAVDAIEKRLRQYDKVYSVQKQLDEAAKEFRAAEAAGHAVSIEAQQKIIDGIQAQIKVKKESSAAFNDGVNAEVTALKLRDQLIQEQTKQQVKDIESLYKQGLVSRIDSIHQETAVEIDAINQRKALLQQELDIAAQKKNSQNEQARLRGEIAKLDQQASDIVQEDANKEAEAIQKMWDASRKVYEDELAAEQKNLDKIYEQIAVVQQEIDTHGKSAIAIQQVTLAREQERASRMAALELWGPELDKLNEEIAARQKLIEVMSAKKIQDGNDAAAKKAEEAWTHTEHSIEEGLYNAITEGGGSAAKKLLKDMENWFAHLVLQPLIQPIGQMGASLLQGAGGVAGGGGGLGSLLSTGGSLLNGGSLSNAGGIVGAFSQGFSGSAAIGTGSSFASTVGGGLATDAMGAGVAEGAAAAGIETGVSAGVTAGLAAVPVVGWIGLAALALYSIFGGKGGGPKTEGGYAPGGIDISGIDIGGSVQGSQRGNVGDAKTLSDAINTGLTGLGNQFGVSLAENIGVFFAKDPQGTSQTQLQVVSDNYNRSKTEGGIENVGRSDAEFQAALAKATAQLDLTELAHALTGKIGDYLKALDPTSLTTDQITADIQLALNAKQLTDAFTKLGPAFSDVADMSVTGLNNLVTSMGGIQKATTDLSSYYANYYTATEQHANAVKDITTALNAAGLQVTADQVGNATREQFRQLVEYELSMGDAGAKAAQALISVNAAFASIASTVTQSSLTAKLQSAATGFVSPDEMARIQATNIQSQLAGAGLNFSTSQIMGASVEQVRQLYQNLVSINNLNAADAVLNVAQAFLTMKSNANAAAQAQGQLAAAYVAGIQAVLAQRDTLKQQLLQLTDPTAALAASREKELAAMNTLLWPLQKAVWAQQDLATATATYTTQMTSIQSTLEATIKPLQAMNDGLQAFLDTLATSSLGGLTGSASYAASKQALYSATPANVQQAVQTFLAEAAKNDTTALQYQQDVGAARQAIMAQQGVNLNGILGAQSSSYSDMQQLALEHQRQVEAAQALTDAANASYNDIEPQLFATTPNSPTQQNPVVTDAAIQQNTQETIRARQATEALLSHIRQLSPRGDAIQTVAAPA